MSSCELIKKKQYRMGMLLGPVFLWCEESMGKINYDELGGLGGRTLQRENIAFT